MMSRVLGIKDVEVSVRPVEMVCEELDSCIAVFVTDRIRKVSGGAYIPLLCDDANAEMKCVAELIDELLYKLERKGGSINRLRAKIAGGANILDPAIDAGRHYTQSILELLQAKKIYISGSDLGGKTSRSVRFNSVTQELMISTSEQENYII
jgi:chemotaxis protein CheD